MALYETGVRQYYCCVIKVTISILKIMLACLFVNLTVRSHQSTKRSLIFHIYTYHKLVSLWYLLLASSLPIIINPVSRSSLSRKWTGQGETMRKLGCKRGCPTANIMYEFLNMSNQREATNLLKSL